MKIWMICPYGPVPGEGWREYRFAAMGRALAGRGHTVLWWTASFAHHFKRQRVRSSTTEVVCPGFSIRFVRTSGYRRHVGLARLAFEAIFAWRLYQYARNLDAPDVIITGDTTMASSQVAIALAGRFRARLVVDVMDLWPEIFATALPRWAQRYAPTILAPLYALRKRTLSSADAIIAVTKAYLEVARQAAPRLSAKRCVVAYIGIDLASMRWDGLPAARLKLPVRQAGEVFAIYAGTLGTNYDIDTLLEACSILQRVVPFVRIVIAGSGPRAADIERFIAKGHCSTISFLGTVEAAILPSLYGACDIALSLYSKGSTVAMPVKVFDYLAAGLPIVNSLPGELANMLQRYEAGIRYTAGDPVSLSAGIRSLAVNAAKREAMSRNSHALAGKFESGVQYSRATELIESLDTH